MTAQSFDFRFAPGYRLPGLIFGVTFATNADHALCVLFHAPVRTLEPTGRLRHPAATLTVADPAGLSAALAPDTLLR